MANPGRRVLTGTELGIVVGSGQEAVTAAMQVAYSRPPPLEEASDMAEEAKTRFEVRLWALGQLIAVTVLPCMIPAPATDGLRMCIDYRALTDSEEQM